MSREELLVSANDGPVDNVLVRQKYSQVHEKRDCIRGGSGQIHWLPRRPQATDERLQLTRARILREIRSLSRRPVNDCTVERKLDKTGQEDIFNWRLTILGREGSAYEGGTFVVDLVLPQEYPQYAPEVKVVTPTFHYNIEDKGTLFYWDIVQDKWEPAITMTRVINEFIAMLFLNADPDPEVHRQAKAVLLREEPGQYDKCVREWTRRYGRWRRIEEYRGTMVRKAGVCPVGTDQVSRRIKGQHVPNALETTTS